MKGFKNVNAKNLTLTATFLALGVVLPFFTGQIPEIGSMLLPMHIPVFLCAFIVGGKWGTALGFILPLLRAVLFGRPNPYPEAVSIAFEMATYALVAGYFYGKSKWKCIRALYRSMLIAMFFGRVVRGIAQFLLMKAVGLSLTFNFFMTAVVISAIPGIILQLIAVPLTMVVLGKTKLIEFGRKREKAEGENC